MDKAIHLRTFDYTFIMDPSIETSSKINLRVFEAMPGNSVLLLPDAPTFTIAAATNGYEQLSLKPRDAFIGKGLLEACPTAKDEQHVTGLIQLKESLEKVLQKKEPHHLPLHRYDIQTGDGDFEERYWSVVNTPVLSEKKEVLYIIHSVQDVAAQIKATQKEAAYKSIEKTFGLFMHAPFVTGLVKSENHVLEMANEAALALWGKEEGIIGKPLAEVIPEIKGQGILELFDQVKQTGKPYISKATPVVSMANGKEETHYFDLVYQPYYEDDSDKAAGVFTISYDVTAQVLARKKIEENEARLQQHVAERTADLEQQRSFISSILDASLDGIYAVKAIRSDNGDITDFTYLFANKHIASFLKLSPDQMIGASMLKLLPENKDNGFFDLFCNQLQKGEPYRDEVHFVAQAMDHWFDYVIVPIDKDILVVTVEDITSKKQSAIQLEEQNNLLDNILRNSSNGISISRVFRDENGTVIDALTILANDAAVRYIGLPREIYLTKKATEIEPAIMGSPYYQACINTLQTGEPFVMQYQMQSTNRWLELTVSRLDHDHLIQIFTDVTPIKEAQLQLEKHVEELQRSNKNLEEFAYAASHDMKEPIRKISFFTDRLRSRLNDKLGDEDLDYFKRLEGATQRMNTLIDDLLTYSHFSKGLSQEEEVDLNQTLLSVKEDMELVLEEKGGRVVVEPLPLIKGQKRQLQQLFENLINNALKYNKPGVAPVVNIRSKLVTGGEALQLISRADAGKQYHLIEVQDNGIGFDQADAERIFNVFTRLHGISEYKGSGVGLSIVRKVAENHKGFIWAEGKEGEGAVFKVLLPAL